MRRQAIAVAVLILAIMGPAPARALDPGKSLAECSVDTWRSRQGVPGWVRALTQTADGYLWVGTGGGLVRYGGGRVTVIEPALPLQRASDVNGLLAARDGTLWIAPARGDPVCVRAGVLADCLPAGQGLAPGTRIVDLHQDAEGAIWLATDEGIYRFAAGVLTLVHPAARLPFERATALHRDGRGRLWLGAAGGLFVTGAVGVGAVVPQALLPGAELGFVTSFFETPGGRLWVVGERGLLRVDGDSATLFGAAEGFPPGRPTQVIEDRDGNVWFGGRRGLTRFRAGAGFVSFTREHGLPDDDVTAVLEDREGSLWVGTRGGGISQFTDRTLDGQAGPPSLRERWINTVAEDGAGALWIGTRAGLTRWKDGQERTFTRADGLPADHVLSVWPGRDGEVWAGTEGGLARWQAGKLAVPVPLATSVSALYQDDKGVLWLGTGEGLARLAGGRLERLPVEGGATLNEIRGMLPDDQGTLWLSAGGRLLRVVDGKVMEVRSRGGPPLEDIGAVGKVRSLHRSADGTLWLGTFDGLVRNRGGVWRRFDADAGVVPRDLYQVLDDGRGFLWAGTTQGIARIARQALEDLEVGLHPSMGTVSFHASDQRREVAAVRARQPGAWKGRDGRLWFATSRGVVTIDPARLRVNSRPPTVVIEEAMVDGRPARRGVPNAFAPGSGALEFHFAGISLIEPHKVRHRYRLEGFDAHWVEAGTRRVAYYTNIGPGTYRFRVQASNADGVWNREGDLLELTLAPHFYQTWWFYALCGLGALGLVFSFHRMHVAEVHSRYAATFAERNRVARELHDSLLQGMAAALLHMKGLRKRVARGQSGQPGGAVTGELQTIESLIARNMEETRQFVFDLREQPVAGGDGEQEPIAVALARLVDRLRGEGPAKLRLRVEGRERALPWQVSRELLRIAQEAIVNAQTHAQAAHVEVELVQEAARLQLRVRDDGRGFDPQAARGAAAGHFGLVGMRERAASIGSFVLESRPGQGTTIVVTISERELKDG